MWSKFPVVVVVVVFTRERKHRGRLSWLDDDCEPVSKRTATTTTTLLTATSEVGSLSRLASLACSKLSNYRALKAK